MLSQVVPQGDPDSYHQTSEGVEHLPPDGDEMEWVSKRFGMFIHSNVF